MAHQSLASGTQSATVTTEHSLSTQTGAYEYQLVVNLSNMVAGDEVELRIKTKVLTGGAAALAYFASYANVQAAPIVISEKISSLFSVEFTLKQTAGTSRNFEWNVLRTDLLDVNVVSAANDVITAAVIADGAIDAGALASNTITAAKIASDAITSAKIADGALTAAKFASDFFQAIWDKATSALTTAGSIGKLLVDNINATIGSRSSHSAADVWAVATRILTAGTNIVLAKGTGVTGFNDLSAAQVNTEVDTALADYDAPTKAELDSAVAPLATASALSTVSNLVDDLEGRLSAARAGYLDNLNVGGNVASSAEVVVIQNNTRVVRVVPDTLERPDSGSIAYRIELLLYDTQGNMEAPDSAPTIGVVNQGGTSRDANLDSTTMSLVSAGRYRSTYTMDSAHALEELMYVFTIVEGGATRIYVNPSLVVDATAVDFTSADRTKLEAMFNKLPSKNYLAGTTNSDGDAQLDEMTGGFSTAAKADINAQADLALADYDPPTGAELVSEINSVQADIAALNNLSSAQAQTAATAALNAYDPPTNAEMVARTLPTASYATAALQAILEGKIDTIDSIVDAILVDTGTTLDGKVDVIAALIDAIKAKTDDLNFTGTDVKATLDGETVTLASLSAAIRNQIADNVLRRSTANLEASSDGDTLGERSAYGVMAAFYHKNEVDTGTNIQTIYKSDGTTPLTTRQLTTDPDAEPVIAAEPA